jgi:AcrR family transcriptional regulator
VSNPRRVRTSRALKNDESLRIAAIEEILEVGVDHLSLREVSRRAGLTHGAAYARFEDVNELLVDLWTSTLRARMEAICDLALLAAEKPDSENVGAALSLLRKCEPADVAAVHVLLVARRIPTLHEEVEPFITNFLEPDSDLTADSEAIFTRSVVLFAFFMVRLLVDSQYGPKDDYYDALEQLLKGSLLIHPAEVAKIASPQGHERPALEVSDDLKSQLEFATFKSVGTSGYAQATVSRIARLANSSPGAIYKTHISKEGLLADSFVSIIGARWIAASTFSSLLDEGSIAGLLEFEASVRNDLRRNFMLESILAAAYSQRIRTAIFRQISDLETLLSRVVDVDDAQKLWIAYMLRTLYSLAVGVGWLATITDTAKDHDFNQFAEPFRRTLRQDCLPDWQRISETVLGMKITDPRRSFGAISDSPE